MPNTWLTPKRITRKHQATLHAAPVTRLMPTVTSVLPGVTRMTPAALLAVVVGRLGLSARDRMPLTGGRRSVTCATRGSVVLREGCAEIGPRKSTETGSYAAI